MTMTPIFLTLLKRRLIATTKPAIARPLASRQGATRTSDISGQTHGSLTHIGAVAQLGERCDGIAEVVGSNPSGSTIFHISRQLAC